MGELEKCQICGELIPLFAAPLSDTAVIKGKCQKCHPKEVDVLYVPKPDSDDNDHSREESGSGNKAKTDDREKLTKGNIRKVESGDRIEFRDDDGCIRVLKVTNHAKPQRAVEGRVERNGKSVRDAFGYKKLLKNGQILFKYPELRANWENRLDMPFDYPTSDSENEKTLQEAVKRGYIDCINFISTSMEKVSNLITQALELSASYLLQAAGCILDVAIAPWKTFYFATWKHGALKEKLTNGEITQRQYESECNEYRKYFGKTAVTVGCAAGGLAAYGIGKLLMASAEKVVIEQLTIVWLSKGLTHIQVGKLVITTLKIIRAKSAVEALTWLCTMFPKLRSVVAIVGGAQTFLTIGAISLIVAGGLTGYYINSKCINKKPIEQLASKISTEKKNY